MNISRQFHFLILYVSTLLSLFTLHCEKKRCDMNSRSHSTYLCAYMIKQNIIIFCQIRLCALQMELADICLWTNSSLVEKTRSEHRSSIFQRPLFYKTFTVRLFSSSSLSFLTTTATGIMSDIFALFRRYYRVSYFIPIDCTLEIFACRCLKCSKCSQSFMKQ